MIPWVSFTSDEPGVFAFARRAYGVVAVGQHAVGVVAIGQVARGVVAVGQGAIGLVAVGQAALGVVGVGQASFALQALGQLAIGPIRANGLVAVAPRAWVGLRFGPLHLDASKWRGLEILPRDKPAPDLPRVQPLGVLLRPPSDASTQARDAWVEATLSRGASGPVLALEHPGGPVTWGDGVAAQAETLLAGGRAKVLVVAHLRESVTPTADAHGYRTAVSFTRTLGCTEVRSRFVAPTVSRLGWCVRYLASALLVLAWLCAFGAPLMTTVATLVPVRYGRSFRTFPVAEHDARGFTMQGERAQVASGALVTLTGHSSAKIIDCDLQAPIVLDLRDAESVAVRGGTLRGEVRLVAGRLSLDHVIVTGDIHASDGCRLALTDATVNGDIDIYESSELSLTNVTLNGGLRLDARRGGVVSVRGGTVSGTVALDLRQNGTATFDGGVVKGGVTLYEGAMTATNTTFEGPLGLTRARVTFDGVAALGRIDLSGGSLTGRRDSLGGPVTLAVGAHAEGETVLEDATRRYQDFGVFEEHACASDVEPCFGRDPVNGQSGRFRVLVRRDGSVKDVIYDRGDASPPVQACIVERARARAFQSYPATLRTQTCDYELHVSTMKGGHRRVDLRPTHASFEVTAP